MKTLAHVKLLSNVPESKHTIQIIIIIIMGTPITTISGSKHQLHNKYSKKLAFYARIVSQSVIMEFEHPEYTILALK